MLHSLEACQGKAELKAEFVQLRAKGLPYVRIAERLGVCKATLANWNAGLEAEIASARAMELEALQGEYFLLKEGGSGFSASSSSGCAANWRAGT